MKDSEDTAGGNPEDFVRGRAQALENLAAGKLKYMRHGHPGPWGDEFSSLMKERLGVHVEDTAGCLVDPPHVSFDEGYNEVVLDEIKRVHGADAFSSLLEEAKTPAQIRHDKYLREHQGG